MATETSCAIKGCAHQVFAVTNMARGEFGQVAADERSLCEAHLAEWQQSAQYDSYVENLKTSGGSHLSSLASVKSFDSAIRVFIARHA